MEEDRGLHKHRLADKALALTQAMVEALDEEDGWERLPELDEQRQQALHELFTASSEEAPTREDDRAWLDVVEQIQRLNEALIARTQNERKRLLEEITQWVRQKRAHASYTAQLESDAS